MLLRFLNIFSPLFPNHSSVSESKCFPQEVRGSNKWEGQESLLIVMSWFLLLAFDINLLFVINHFICFGCLLEVNFFLWEFLNNGEHSCFLLVVLDLWSGQFFLFFVYIYLFVLFLLHHLHIYWGFFNWLFSWLFTEILNDCQSDFLFFILVHIF